MGFITGLHHSRSSGALCTYRAHFGSDGLTVQWWANIRGPNVIRTTAGNLTLTKAASSLDEMKDAVRLEVERFIDVIPPPPEDDY